MFLSHGIGLFYASLIQDPHTFWGIQFFFHKTHFHKQRQAENQTNAKQHPKAELWLSDNYSHSLTTLSSTHNSITHILKKKHKSKCVFIYETTRLTIMKMKMKMKKIDHIDVGKTDLGLDMDTYKVNKKVSQ